VVSAVESEVAQCGELRLDAIEPRRVEGHEGELDVVGGRPVADLSRLPDRLGPRRTGTLALTMIVAGTGVAAIWQQAPGVYVATIVLSAGVALLTPALMSAALHGVADHERASAVATFTAFLDISVAVTGPLIGLIIGGFGYATAFTVAAGLGLVALAILRFGVAVPPRTPIAIAVPRSGT
jgi:MFS family permease